jgi:hypothetical protein
VDHRKEEHLVMIKMKKIKMDLIIMLHLLLNKKKKINKMIIKIQKVLAMKLRLSH